MQRAIGELKDLITQHYPGTTFRVERSPEDPRIIHLVPTVDVEDTDEVLDVVIDRMMEIQIKDKLPLFVIPLRTPEREAAVRRELERERAAHQAAAG